MGSAFEQAKHLVSQKKYKKALLVLRKLNQKQMLFESIELESVCLFHEKNYQLAFIKMEQALLVANASNQKLSILNNLGAVCEKLNCPEKAIEFLKQILEIDNSLNTALQRLSLIKSAFSVSDYETVEKYGPLLINVQEYSLVSLIILSQTAINQDNFESALKYLSRIVAEIRIEDATKIEQKDIIFVLNGLHTIEAYSKEKQLLEFLSPKFHHEVWFKEVQQRFETSNNSMLHNTNKHQNDTIKQQINITSKKPFADGDVVGDNPKTVLIIKKLKSLLESMGANFHRNMSIIEKDDNLSVSCNCQTNQNEKFMDVPIKCMPLINDYRFSLDYDDKLQVQFKKNMLNPSAKQVMMLLVNMFNATNKLVDWKNNYPLFALAGFEDIIKKLLQARSNHKSFLEYYFPNVEKISNDAIISSFISARVFSFTQTSLRKAGIKSQNLIEDGFIPIIELANHKMGAPGFQCDNNSSSLKVYTEQGDHQREIFVQYNLDDPLITLLTYGFVDQSASWIYTVPVILRTQMGINIEVHNNMNMIAPSEVPDHLRGLASYLPARTKRTGNIVSVSKLIIPSMGYYHTLKAVLSYLIKKIDTEGNYIDPRTLNYQVELLEKQLLELNKQYWNELLDLINNQNKGHKPINPVVSKQLIELCHFSLNHIDKYISQSGYLVKK